MSKAEKLKTLDRLYKRHIISKEFQEHLRREVISGAITILFDKISSEIRD